MKPSGPGLLFFGRFLFVCFFGGTWASHCCGLSHCGEQAPDAQPQRPWLTGPAALRHVGSSRTGARAHVPCIGRRTLNHCATREAQCQFLKIKWRLQPAHTHGAFLMKMSRAWGWPKAVGPAQSDDPGNVSPSFPAGVAGRGELFQLLTFAWDPLVAGSRMGRDG